MSDIIAPLVATRSGAPRGGCKTARVRERPAPTTGQAIMFTAVAAGWFVLFLINLVGFDLDTGWWLRTIFSGVFLIAATALAVVLWRRRRKPPA
ncbi:MAG: hypothetical protein H0W01_15935 [Pseudonocardiales bacterium]|nr:hypothetical protein [Pseudonocardiales bacterium]